MSWVPLYIPDFILAPSFCYFLVVLSRTNDGALRTPFFSFFIATGICGISTVLTHILINRVIWPASVWWMQTILLDLCPKMVNSKPAQVINQSGQLGATFGKLFIVIHRYCVLRGVAVSESIWSPTVVWILIVIQFVVPTALTGSFFSFGYLVQTTVNGSISFSIASQGLVIQKIVNNSFMVTYCTICVGLTYLSSRKLSELTTKLEVMLEGHSKRAILKQQKNMFIIVAVCCLSHILKAGQQSLVIIFSMNGTISRQLYETLLWPTFVATNGLATYSPPLILLFRSRRARALFFGGLRGPIQARNESTVHTVTDRTR
ncbi:hypothetical protein PRIPAC_82785 [Pristionchus pacificus]|uniref:G protein-coupled receptor n=1 Tax=Pristionchus pacificus TaxID=54126 RepID=A0A2A6CMN6_PRIPA|nr:hypothetical protein PRIPAC_82785 [Pristionchus pacificus]|eukprot:PDM79505.1 G protein-coupled receptor [Pristionchus pacificus]